MTIKLLPALAATLFLNAGSPPAAPEADPRALMLQARSLQREGGGNDPKTAAALYQKVIALVPNSAQAYLRLSESLLESGNAQAAVEPAIKATELDPKSGEAWAHLGLLYYFQSQNHESFRPPAVAALRQAVRLLPTDPELWTRLAETLESLKDQDGALKAWVAVGRLHPSATYRQEVLSDFAWERAVQLAILLKNYDLRREAVLALNDRPDGDPRYLRFLENLAQDQVASGFLGHAEESFRLLGQYVPEEPAVWENIAIIQLRTGSFEDALQTLAKAESMRKSVRTSFNTGLCLMKLGKLTEAEARWKALLPSLDSSGEKAELAGPVKVLYATCVLLSGRPKEMLDLSAPWPEAGSNPELASLRAQALVQVQDWKQARTTLRDGMTRFPDQDLFQRAAQLPPTLFDEGRFFKSESREALTQLDQAAMAGLWAEFQNWNRCLDTVLQARKSAPVRSVELLLLQANALENLGRHDESIAVLREGQKLDPRNPTLENNLGFSLLERGGHVDESAQLIKAALDQDPKNASTMDSWGWALFKQGKFKEAEDVLRKAAAMSPYSPEVHQHLGEVLVKLNQPEEALAEWERALPFAFPGRKELEEKAQALRTTIAKLKSAQEGTNQVEDTAGADEGDEDEGID